MPWKSDGLGKMCLICSALNGTKEVEPSRARTRSLSCHVTAGPGEGPVRFPITKYVSA